MKNYTSNEEEIKHLLKIGKTNIYLYNSSLYIGESLPPIESYEEYREPEDPISAEFVRVKTRKSVKFWKWYKLIGVMIPIVFAYFMLINSGESIGDFYQIMLLLSISLYFLIRGTILAVSSVVTPKKLKARCTYPIMAKFIDVTKCYDRNKKRTYYYPVYKYYYKGKFYILFSSFSNTSKKLEIGQEIQLFINKDDPHDYCYEYEFITVNTLFYTLYAIIPMAVNLIFIFKIINRYI